MSEKSLDYITYTLDCLSSGEEIQVEECGSDVIRVRMVDEENDWQETYLAKPSIEEFIEKLSRFVKKGKL